MCNAQLCWLVHSEWTIVVQTYMTGWLMAQQNDQPTVYLDAMFRISPAVTLLVACVPIISRTNLLVHDQPQQLVLLGLGGNDFTKWYRMKFWINRDQPHHL